MARERTTRITIETDRVLIVAKLKGVRITCEHCGQEVEWETLEMPEPVPQSALPIAAEVFPRNFRLGDDDGAREPAWRSALRFFRGLTGGSPL